MSTLPVAQVEAVFRAFVNPAGGIIVMDFLPEVGNRPMVFKRLLLVVIAPPRFVDLRGGSK